MFYISLDEQGDFENVKDAVEQAISESAEQDGPEGQTISEGAEQDGPEGQTISEGAEQDGPEDAKAKETKGRDKLRPVFIAGVIYEADTMKEIEAEKRRIRAYLSAVCRAAGKKYPEDMHISDQNTGEDVGAVKAEVTRTLQDFFRDADYPGKGELSAADEKRQGRYHIYVYLKSRRGKTGRNAQLSSEWMKDSFAGNLYVHMAEDVVNRLMFHNPVLDGDNTFLIDLATRKFVYNDKNKDYRYLEKLRDRYLDEFQKLGYQEYHSKNMGGIRRDGQAASGGGIRRASGGGALCIAGQGADPGVNINLTNRHSYWNSIERETFAAEKKITLKNFNVRSIQYTQEAALRMGFLYLADLVCSNLGWDLPKADEETCDAVWIGEFEKRLEGYVGDRHLFYLYDDVDTVYGKALRQYEQRNYFEALEYMYEAHQMKGACAEHYRRHMFSDLMEAMCRNVKVEKLYSAVLRMSDFSYSNQGGRDKLRFLFEHLERLHGSVRKGEQGNLNNWKRYSYELFDVGASAYTHMGDGRSARRCLLRCREYADGADLEKQIVTGNKLAVYYQDRFAYRTAFRETSANVQKAGEILAALSGVGYAVEKTKLVYGIALSQHGQCAAVCRTAAARKTFLKALDCMKGDEANYLITLSYFLHFLIRKNQKAQYQRWAQRYFGTGDPEEQFEAVLDEMKKQGGEERRFYPEFALYVWVKAANVFDISISGDLMKKLLAFDKTVKQAKINVQREAKGHPWELIYKHLALICYKAGYKKEADDHIRRAEMVQAQENQIIDAVKLKARLQYAELTGDAKAGKQWLARLVSCLEKINPRVFAGLSGKTEEAQRRTVEKYICYMYD